MNSIALSWTLFHSLWQGLIFAFIAGVTMMLTRRSSAAFRYNALSALFVLFIVTTIATYFYEQQKVGPVHTQQASVSHPVKITIDHPQTWAAVNSDTKFSPAQVLSNFFSQYAYLIVAIWFFILCGKSVRIIFTLLYTRRLRTYKSHVPALYWREEIAYLCHQLKISRPVTLLESEIIRLPLVFGHLKPIIFIPLGLLSNLAPEQVEAILVHELAHIRRNDYLVNLVQNLVEVLFFFNPAILWISSLIREERENCCDDIAIAQTRNKKRYIEALISFKELSLYNNSKNAVAFPGDKNNFLNRVSRIVQNKNYTLSTFEKGSLLSCCIIATLLVLAFAHPAQGHRVASTPPSPYTLPPPIFKTAGSVPISGEKLSSHKLRQVITDLVSEKVVSDTSEVMSFALLDTELIVNHQRQPEALHQRLKAKYGIHDGYGWYYGPVNISGKGLWIDLTARMPTLRQPQPSPPDQRKRSDRPINPMSNFLAMVDGVIDDLIGENVVNDRSGLISFHLTNQFLMVNGQRQPDEIQKKLREKYLVDPPANIDRRLIEDPNFGIHYYPKTGSMGIGISINTSDPVISTLPGIRIIPGKS
jgi:beta-lactamase regulating signal transducer with metallopeptidase domain